MSQVRGISAVSEGYPWLGGLRDETKEEFRRYVETMEQLDRRAESGRSSPEERALLKLLERLIQDYDDRDRKSVV